MSNQLPPDLDAWLALSPGAKAEANQNFKAIARRVDPTHEQYGPGIPGKQLAAEAGVSEAKICRLLKWWKNGRYDRTGRQLAPPRCKAALAPSLPGPPRGRPRLVEEVIQEIKDIAANLMRRSGIVRARTDQRGEKVRIPYKAVWKELCAKQEMVGGKAPSFTQVRAILRRVPYQTRTVWAGGIEALKKEGCLQRLLVPPPGAPNVVWLLDQWKCDVFVRYEDGEIGRPTAVSVIDAFGGGFVLAVIVHRRFTAHTVAEALIVATDAHGRTLNLRLDLGKENQARLIWSGCQHVGTNIMVTTPLDPAVKGLQEQTHNSYRRFCSTLPWYAPSDIKTKPLREEDPLPFAEFVERFKTFVLGEYNRAPYTGLYAEGGKSRLEIRQASQFTPVRIPEQELRVLFAEAKLVTVWPQGIKLHGLIYGHPELGKHIGQKVWARQGRTEAEVIVHDEEMHLVCVANNALAASAHLDDEGRRQFTADRRALAKALETQADEMISRARNKPDWLLMRAQKRMEEYEGQPPRPGIRQITPATGQTPAVANAQGEPRLKRYRWQR